MVNILKSTKTLLGISVDDTNFDNELIVHINSAITILTQLGVGPEEGFVITADTLWTDFIGDRKDLEIIRSYIYLRVRLLFDPPQNSFLVTSIDNQCKEYEWRIAVQSSPPPEPVPIDDTTIMDTYDEYYDYEYYE